MNFDVNALAADAGGNVFAGGGFTQVCGNEACNSGNTTANHIARWYLTDWHALGSGAGGAIDTLALDGSGNLYAGGNTQVTKWNGSSWSQLGSGVNTPSKGLAAKGNKLFVGGRFTTAGGKASSRIAQWTIVPSFRIYLPIVVR
jgi:hypothetical protein